jgi:hypothetical protein
VTAWLGNTPRIALKHYLQVTDADFARAAAEPIHNTAMTTEGMPEGAAESGAANWQTMQYPVQQNGAVRRKDSHKKA